MKSLKSSSTFFVAPNWMYVVRVAAPAGFPFLFAAFLFLPAMFDLSLHYIPLLLLNLVISWASISFLMAIPIMIRRPKIFVSPNLLEIQVSDYFSKKLTRLIYGTQGYGFDYINMVIDFVKPIIIPTSEIGGFMVEKVWFWYKVYALGDNFRTFLCIRSTRKGAEVVAEGIARSAKIKFKLFNA